MAKASEKRTQKKISGTSKSVSSKHQSAAKGGVGAVKPKQAIILETIAKLHAIGMEAPSRKNVQAFSGNTKTKAGFEKNLGQLKKGGYLTYGPGSTLILSEKGSSLFSLSSSASSALTNESIHEDMKEMLSPKARLIFDALLDGERHDRKVVALELGYDMSKLSGYQKDISKMKTLGFLEYPTKTEIRLSDTCFPLGRP